MKRSTTLVLGGFFAVAVAVLVVGGPWWPTSSDEIVHLRSSTALRGIHGDPDPRQQSIDFLKQGPTRFEGHRLRPTDISGNHCPVLLRADEVDIPPEEEVIGVAVNDRYHAYLVEALSLVQDHVINELVDGVPISMTYCDQDDYARVLTSADLHQPIDLRVGGMLTVGSKTEMVLTLDGIRYRQDSPELPLEDHEFDRTVWGAWILKHPRTLVFIGEMNRYRRTPAEHEDS